MNDLCCPSCHSDKVRDSETFMECLGCGNRENLIDYPIATAMYELPEEKPEIFPIIPPEHKLFGRLQQTEGKLLYLQNKLNEHIDKSRSYKKDIL